MEEQDLPYDASEEIDFRSIIKPLPKWDTLKGYFSTFNEKIRKVSSIPNRSFLLSQWNILCKELEEIVKKFKSLVQDLFDFNINDPVILILDKDSQAFPWEGCLDKLTLTRTPSLHFLRNFLPNNDIISGEKLYYVNPDIEGSSELIKSCFVRYREEWKGIYFDIGHADVKNYIRSELPNNDIFIYCGHNGGEYLLPTDTIMKMKNVPKIVMLMGCSSGALKPIKLWLETFGMYLVATWTIFLQRQCNQTEITKGAVIYHRTYHVSMCNGTFKY
ncbi:hypothetical protein PROFUN_12533 [Planoprotostelium fungivorum]|uniref:separase n=1 Tax=Planoprotostelium fungivorum TaxID=1890364 RepID=A0A2P6MS37_9EUKA|nr:hypothetical protein PROFUN_12533 [Planoprotostelium fungivorum]